MRPLGYVPTAAMKGGFSFTARPKFSARYTSPARSNRATGYGASAPTSPNGD
nr:MAG TPA: hypothetical protein [Caudoviricetes sp.]